MTIAFIIVNVVFAVGVVGAMVALHGWAIATQHHDHGVESAGPLVTRRVWSRHSRPHAGPVRPWIASGRRGEVWPASL
jgi:hypothetical protein